MVQNTKEIQRQVNTNHCIKKCELYIYGGISHSQKGYKSNNINGQVQLSSHVNPNNRL